jgi:AraC-like DNA-binding protein
VTFLIETKPSSSALVDHVWRARSADPGAFISTASVYWELVLTAYYGDTRITVRGPQTRAIDLAYSAGIEWLGIRFRLGAFMPHLPLAALANGRDAALPLASATSFWLANAPWQLPTFDNADEFVRRLERSGVLTCDPVVHTRTDSDGQRSLSTRSIQYHYALATGLSPSMIRQIERARTAARLLERGTSVLDTVHHLGYFDQPHMTRSLKRFLGRTPAQIARGD